LSEPGQRKKPLQVERQLQILNLLKSQQAVRIEELSEMLGVSANTIRRDLRALEQQGVVDRKQGGALLADGRSVFTSFSTRSAEHAEGKKQIARLAAEMVGHRSTVILDAGTTTYEIFSLLSEREDLTIITNSLMISVAATNSCQASTILCGGIILEAPRSLIGLPAEQFFNQIHADVLFLAVSGVSANKGFTNRNLHETPIKRKMMEASRQIIAVADSSKVGHDSLSPIAELSEVDALITDADASDEVVKALEARGLEVLRPQA
jgi:DeoR/GlpR family transcriptional regulator of sugar metabolism